MPASEDARRQFAELERLQAVLDNGSTSLNHRATTLAGLAVAALGAVGIFATRLADVEPNLLTRLAAISLIVSAIGLILTTIEALRAASPECMWANAFSEWATSVIGGYMTREARLLHLEGAIKHQLGRNQGKVGRMKRAYDGCRVAILGVAIAVVLTAADGVAY
jgi:hypothetical protein